MHLGCSSIPLTPGLSPIGGTDSPLPPGEGLGVRESGMRLLMTRSVSG